MNIQRLSYALIAFLVISLSACGGSTGGGDDPNNPTDPVDPGTPPVSSNQITVLAGQSTLPSGSKTAAEGIQITAIVRNANNNVVSGETVSFRAEGGLIQVTQQTTDESGTATAQLFAGEDPSNRQVTVTATSGSGTDNVVVTVGGSQLGLEGPTALALNDMGTYTVELTDSDGEGISGQAVTIDSQNGNTLAMGSSSTDGNGQAQFSLTATQAGSDVLTASSLGLTAQLSLQVAGDDFQISSPAANTTVELGDAQDVTLAWATNGIPQDGELITFSTTRGSFVGGTNTATTDPGGQATVQVISNNAGPATITATSDTGLRTTLTLQFIAVTPGNIDVQADPAIVPQGGQSTVTAIVRDANNNLVTGAVVNFTLTDTSGGSLRDGSVTTGIRGTASTVYTAGNTSATDPATITATVEGGIVDQAAITVGGQALRIVLGTGNEIVEPTTTTYSLPYVAIVTDAAGNPATDASFRLSIESLSYQKGVKVRPDGANSFIPVYAIDVPDMDVDDDGFDSFGCLNEDANRNGIINAGEDVNDNDRLDPGNVASVPGIVPLDQSGTAEFEITYPQDRSDWVRVRLRAVASVQGTETTEEAVFVLPMSASDATGQGSPPGVNSPYGTSTNCTDTD